MKSVEIHAQETVNYLLWNEAHEFSKCRDEAELDWSLKENEATK